MHIIDRYLLASLVKPLLVSIAGLSLLFLSSIIFEMGTYLIVRRVHPYLVALLLIYKIPSVLIMTLPIGSFFAMLFALGQMAKDREITIFRMAGMRTARILAPYLTLSVLLCGIAYSINEFVISQVNIKAEQIIRRIIFDTPPPELMQNVFFADKQRYYFIGNIAPATKTMQSVMIFELKEGKMEKLVTAEYGFADSQSWKLHNSISYEFDKQGRIKFESRSAEIVVAEARPDDQVFQVGKSAQDMNRRELKELIVDLKSKGIQTASYEVDYFLKAATPFASLVFVLLGLPLIIRVRRNERLITALICVCIVVSYYVIASLSAAAGRAYLLSPLWAAWLPTVAFSLSGMILLWRADHA